MALTERQLRRELLDDLPAQAPEAVHSRADLRRINGLMRNARWIAKTSGGMHITLPNAMVELACGDGELILQCLRFKGWRPKKLILLDQQPVVTAETLAALREWVDHVEVVTADVFTWLKETQSEHVDLITTNLFLHHFTNEQLLILLKLVAAKSNAFIACEPRRSGFALFNSRLIGLIGCNHVTRHDAVASVEAGFTGLEISKLWPMGDGWEKLESSAGWFSHRFAAIRSGSRKA